MHTTIPTSTVMSIEARGALAQQEHAGGLQLGHAGMQVLRRWGGVAAALMAICTSCGCPEQPPAQTSAPPQDAYGSYNSYYAPGEIKFLDSVQSNADLGPGLAALTFVDVHGQPVSLTGRADAKPVVLVITRGNTNPICPYCSTQTARLISDYEQFVQRGVEVVVVYPVAAEADAQNLEPFLSNVRTLLGDPNRVVPFPVWLDLNLAAVEQLGIRQDLSKPATYIIDAAGQVRFAYVGAHLADRPSNQALFQQIDQLLTIDSGTDPAPAAVETGAIPPS